MANEIEKVKFFKKRQNHSFKRLFFESLTSLGKT